MHALLHPATWTRALGYSNGIMARERLIFIGGAVDWDTMPLLHAKELRQIINKGQVDLALCDIRLIDEMQAAEPVTIVGLVGTADRNAELDRAALTKPARFDAARIGRDNVALVGMTSGSTSEPKAPMHFHRDLRIIADSYAREVLEHTCPPILIEIIERSCATVCVTAPVTNRVVLRAMDQGADLSSLRVAISARIPCLRPSGRTGAAAGKPMLDRIGAIEMLHIFLTNRMEDSHQGCTERTVTRYSARFGDDQGQEVAQGQIDRRSVIRATGCRHLSNARQGDHVRERWTLTGDTFRHGQDRRLHFAARCEDIVVSTG